jgi:hypothetical protein
MKLTLGFAAGFALGYWVGNTTPDERRAKLDDAWKGVRDNPRLHRVADTVAEDARRLGDAVEQRIVTTADGAVQAVAGTVEPDKATSGKTGSARPNGGTRSATN